jgi:hypothetical protein
MDGTQELAHPALQLQSGYDYIGAGRTKETVPAMTGTGSI